MSLIPGNLLDEQYDTQNPVNPAPSTGDKWGAVYDQAVAQMPTVRAYSALQNISDQPEVPAAELNKQFPDNPKPFTKPLAYDSAKNVYDSNVAQVKSQDIINQSSWSPLEQAGKTAVDWLSPIADPIMGAAFAATGPIAEFGSTIGIGAGEIAASILKGEAVHLGEGILGRAAEIGLQGTTHVALATVPIEAASAYTTGAEGHKFTGEQLVNESTNLIGGGALLSGGAGLLIGSLEKFAGKAKLAEKVFAALKPNEQEAQIANQASMETGKGQSQVTAMGLTDTVAMNEAKLGIPAKTGEQQAALIDKLEFQHDPTMSDEMAQKAYATKDLNSIETQQMSQASGDADLKAIADQKWENEKLAFDELFKDQKPENITSENDGNQLVEKYLAEKYPEEMGDKWTEAHEDELKTNSENQNPDDLFKQLTDQRQQQMQELQTNRLEALRESARNGTLNPESDLPGIPKDHVSEPAVPQEGSLDHQISQIDEIQKNLDEEANRGKTEEPLKEGEEKELSPAEEEDQRNEGKFQYVKNIVDCFFKNS